MNIESGSMENDDDLQDEPEDLFIDDDDDEDDIDMDDIRLLDNMEEDDSQQSQAEEEGIMSHEEPVPESQQAGTKANLEGTKSRVEPVPESHQARTKADLEGIRSHVETVPESQQARTKADLEGIRSHVETVPESQQARTKADLEGTKSHEVAVHSDENSAVVSSTEKSRETREITVEVQDLLQEMNSINSMTKSASSNIAPGFSMKKGNKDGYMQAQNLIQQQSDLSPSRNIRYREAFCHVQVIQTNTQRPSIPVAVQQTQKQTAYNQSNTLPPNYVRYTQANAQRPQMAAHTGHRQPNVLSLNTLLQSQTGFQRLPLPMMHQQAGVVQPSDLSSYTASHIPAEILPTAVIHHHSGNIQSNIPSANNVHYSAIDFQRLPMAAAQQQTTNVQSSASSSTSVPKKDKHMSDIHDIKLVAPKRRTPTKGGNQPESTHPVNIKKEFDGIVDMQVERHGVGMNLANLKREQQHLAYRAEDLPGAAEFMSNTSSQSSVVQHGEEVQQLQHPTTVLSVQASSTTQTSSITQSSSTLPCIVSVTSLQTDPISSNSQSGVANPSCTLPSEQCQNPDSTVPPARNVPSILRRNSAKPKQVADARKQLLYHKQGQEFVQIPTQLDRMRMELVGVIRFPGQNSVPTPIQNQHLRTALSATQGQVPLHPNPITASSAISGEPSVMVPLPHGQIRNAITNQMPLTASASNPGTKQSSITNPTPLPLSTVTNPTALPSRQQPTVMNPTALPSRQQSSVSNPTARPSRQQPTATNPTALHSSQQSTVTNLTALPSGQQPTVMNSTTLPSGQQSSVTNPIALPLRQQSSVSNPTARSSRQQPTVTNPTALPSSQQSAVTNPTAWPSSQQPTVTNPTALPSSQQSTVTNLTALPSGQQSTVMNSTTLPSGQQSSVINPIALPLRQQSSVSNPTARSSRQQSTATNPTALHSSQQSTVTTLTALPSGQQPTVMNSTTLPSGQQSSVTNPIALPSRQQSSVSNPTAWSSRQQPTVTNPTALPSSQQSAVTNPTAWPSSQQPTVTNPTALPSGQQSPVTYPTVLPARQNPTVTNQTALSSGQQTTSTNLTAQPSRQQSTVTNPMPPNRSKSQQKPGPLSSKSKHTVPSASEDVEENGEEMDQSQHPTTVLSVQASSTTQTSSITQSSSTLPCIVSVTSLQTNPISSNSQSGVANPGPLSSKSKHTVPSVSDDVEDNVQSSLQLEQNVRLTREKLKYSKLAQLVSLPLEKEQLKVTTSIQNSSAKSSVSSSSSAKSSVSSSSSAKSSVSSSSSAKSSKTVKNVDLLTLSQRDMNPKVVLEKLKPDDISRALSKNSNIQKNSTHTESSTTAHTKKDSRVIPMGKKDQVVNSAGKKGSTGTNEGTKDTGSNPTRHIYSTVIPTGNKGSVVIPSGNKGPLVIPSGKTDSSQNLSGKKGLDSAAGSKPLENAPIIITDVASLEGPEGDWKCYLCLKNFCSKTDMLYHVRFSHSYYTNKDIHSCTHCGKQQKTLPVLLEHEKTHHCIKLSCSFCGKGYPNFPSLQVHVCNHLTPLTYLCMLCREDFSSVELAEKHLTTHQGEVAFWTDFLKCRFCGSLFSKRQKLYDHVHSAHAELFAYKCKSCSQIFYREYALLIHRSDKNHILDGKKLPLEDTMELHFDMRSEKIMKNMIDITDDGSDESVNERTLLKRRKEALERLKAEGGLDCKVYPSTGRICIKTKNQQNVTKPESRSNSPVIVKEVPPPVKPDPIKKDEGEKEDMSDLPKTVEHCLYKLLKLAVVERGSLFHQSVSFQEQINSSSHELLTKIYRNKFMLVSLLRDEIDAMMAIVHRNVDKTKDNSFTANETTFLKDFLVNQKQIQFGDESVQSLAKIVGKFYDDLQVALTSNENKIVIDNQHNKIAVDHHMDWLSFLSQLLDKQWQNVKTMASTALERDDVGFMTLLGEVYNKKETIAKLVKAQIETVKNFKPGNANSTNQSSLGDKGNNSSVTQTQEGAGNQKDQETTVDLTAEDDDDNDTDILEDEVEVIVENISDDEVDDNDKNHDASNQPESSQNQNSDEGLLMDCADETEDDNDDDDDTHPVVSSSHTTKVVIATSDAADTDMILDCQTIKQEPNIDGQNIDLTLTEDDDEDSSDENTENSAKGDNAAEQKKKVDTIKVENTESNTIFPLRVDQESSTGVPVRVKQEPHDDKTLKTAIKREPPFEMQEPDSSTLHNLHPPMKKLKLVQVFSENMNLPPAEIQLDTKPKDFSNDTSVLKEYYN